MQAEGPAARDMPFAIVEGLGHRGTRLRDNGKKSGEPRPQGARPHPLVLPEAGGGSITDLMLNFLDRIPELGPRAMGIHQEILVPQVLAAQDVRPETLVARHEFLDPFDHKAPVHKFGVHDTQAPHGLGPTDGRPPDPMVFTFDPVVFLEKTGPVLVHHLVYSVP